MKHFKIFMMGALMLLFQFCRPSGTHQVAEDKTIDEHLQEGIFMQRVATDGMQAMALARLTLEKGVAPGLKDYAAQMVKDSEQLNSELKLLAQSKSVELPSSLSADEERRIVQMQQMEDKYFEKLYLKMTTERLRKDIVLLKGAQKSPDSAIVNFAHRNSMLMETQLQKVLSITPDL